ncbi:MAG: universal stress protein [Rhodobiaceae bacterium]|nr:universal stress protein [Rhodobiaceae bacterium]
MIESILCATDGSKVSHKAVEFALALAKTMGHPVTFLSVERVSASSATSSPFWDSNVLDAADAITRAEFKAIGDTARKAGVSGVHFITVQSKDVAGAIAAYASEHGHDHIVMGSHGVTGVKSLVLGSVAQSVVAEASVPVTIVR